MPQNAVWGMLTILFVVRVRVEEVEGIVLLAQTHLRRQKVAPFVLIDAQLVIFGHQFKLSVKSTVFYLIVLLRLHALYLLRNVQDLWL